jgi:ATP-binding cassette subfamily B (MDR/TAP) protein 1
VVEKFNLTIRRGTTVALVGQSGSGKSTAVQLLQRFYDPVGGRILVDGTDVRQLNLEWLRSHIGVVSQEPALLDATIMENIRSGKLGATDEECITAAKDANAHDFIQHLPDKYATMCGARGGSLSGGQKQRIAIARGIVRQPEILLLDEATSALDEEAQRIVQAALDRLLKSKQRTTVVVAHRLSTVRSADQIVVLESGRVIESGTFEELTARPGGAFNSLLRAQGQFPA